jgi:hypothetical protein
MRKMLSGGLAVFAGVLSLPTPRSIHAERVPASQPRAADTRLEKLRSFFAKWNCPAKDYSVDFIAAAERYDLDWRLLPSISYLESAGGKNAPNHNLFGWNCGRTAFSSASASIHEVARRLGRSRLYRAKTLDEKLATYNPANAGYARKVRSVMEQIAPAQ